MPNASGRKRVHDGDEGDSCCVEVVAVSVMEEVKRWKWRET
jgi:hypothetical protein